MNSRDSGTRKCTEDGWRADELRRAIGGAQLELHYQPVVELATAAPDGVEALARWRHPEHGLVPPDEFLPSIIEHHLEADLCCFVLDTACTQLAEWQGDALVASDFHVSINATTECFTKSLMPEWVLANIASARIMPESLTVEITEQTVMTEPDAARVNAERLRAMGVRISLDDFGTGYSTLAALSTVPVDELKIDRWFVSRLEDPATATLVEGLIGLARHLGLRVVAEGVETPRQARWLLDSGCTHAQGFLWSPGLPAPEFGALLSGNRPAWEFEAPPLAAMCATALQT